MRVRWIWRKPCARLPEMLAKRVIPCLDVDGGRVVKGVRFVNIRDAGDVADCAEIGRASCRERV